LKKLLNTLYITSKNSYIHVEGETVVVEHEEGDKIRFPIHNLESIVCFGPIKCSSPLMQLCGERKVFITFLSEYGNFYSRVEGPITGNVVLRRAQFRKADDEKVSSQIARSIILAKLLNSRNVLMRAVRESTGDEGDRVVKLENAAEYLYKQVQKLKEDSDIDTIRGIEGDAARAYFSVFNQLIVSQKNEFLFTDRNRRPPLDNVNALLSFVYTLLTHDTRSGLQSVGLDPAVGFMHCDRSGRPGLALDLMEEFRAYLCDRLVLSLINRQQVKAKGFRKTESGAVIMDDDTRKIVLTAYQKRKREEIVHPYLGEKVEIGLLPYVQSQLLARYLRNELDAYPSFFWK